jgi:hypothetical protein
MDGWMDTGMNHESFCYIQYHWHTNNQKRSKHTTYDRFFTECINFWRVSQRDVTVPKASLFAPPPMVIHNGAATVVPCSFVASCFSTLVVVWQNKMTLLIRPYRKQVQVGEEESLGQKIIQSYCIAL